MASGPRGVRVVRKGLEHTGHHARRGRRPCRGRHEQSARERNRPAGGATAQDLEEPESRHATHCAVVRQGRQE
jgi:hypothetical protein